MKCKRLVSAGFITSSSLIFYLTGDVCFEPKDEGSCPDKDIARNLTRWAFNPRSNTCESFSYSGCQGNHNNFHTEQLCNQVCPGKLSNAIHLF